MNFRTLVNVWAAVAVAASASCAGDIGGDPSTDGTVLTGADDSTTTAAALSGDLPLGSTLKTTGNLNLRTGPSTSNSVRLVMPSGSTVTTVNTTSPSNGWYNIKYNGVTGWASGSYLTLVSLGQSGSGGGDPGTGGGMSSSGGGSSSSGGGSSSSGGGSSSSGGGSSSSGGGSGSTGGGSTSGDTISSSTRGGAVLRAQSALHGSYWWGHGKWYPNDVGGTNEAASCTGSCPSCSHSGSSGADCSGYVAKLWQVPSSNDVLSSDSHPYSTSDFVNDTSHWTTVSRSNLIQADALVYNSGGAGHVFLYDSGDGWGSINAYEAKGCSYGILYDLRTASSAYHGIRHY